MNFILPYIFHLANIIQNRISDIQGGEVRGGGWELDREILCRSAKYKSIHYVSPLSQSTKWVQVSASVTHTHKLHHEQQLGIQVKRILLQVWMRGCVSGEYSYDYEYELATTPTPHTPTLDIYLLAWILIYLSSHKRVPLEPVMYPNYKKC